MSKEPGLKELVKYGDLHPREAMDALLARVQMRVSLIEDDRERVAQMNIQHAELHASKTWGWLKRRAGL